MSARWSELFALIIVLLSFVVGIYSYFWMPEKIAVHWNIRGEANVYMPKSLGLFILPLIFAGVTLLLIAIPRIDPLKENIEAFRKYYDWLLIIFPAFLFTTYLHLILWNIGFKINLLLTIPIGIGLTIIYLGFLLEKSKRNWFIGIRTPWTLSSDKVWEKTHKLGGKLFKIAGIIIFLSIFLQEYMLMLTLTPIITITIITTVYSYFEYQKEVKHKN